MNDQLSALMRSLIQAGEVEVVPDTHPTRYRLTFKGLDVARSLLTQRDKS